MDLLSAALLGVVQGLTEFLPVSSTAHLLVGARLIGFEDEGSVFTEMIQLGSMLAIVWLYRDKLVEVARGLPSSSEARRFATLIVVGVVPALAAGALASDFIESVLHKSVVTIGTAFILGGLVMLWLERRTTAAPTRRVDDTSMRQAFGIGLCQMLALVPGVSRSGATIVGGMLMGLERTTAAEFSFFLAMPTLAATFAHSALELRHQLSADRSAELAVGLVAAFLASALVVKPFLATVRRVGFVPFAWYRIVAGLLLLAGAFTGRL